MHRSPVNAAIVFYGFRVNQRVYLRFKVIIGNGNIFFGYVLYVFEKVVFQVFERYVCVMLKE